MSSVKFVKPHLIARCRFCNRHPDWYFDHGVWRRGLHTVWEDRISGRPGIQVKGWLCIALSCYFIYVLHSSAFMKYLVICFKHAALTIRMRSLQKFAAILGKWGDQQQSGRKNQTRWRDFGHHRGTLGPRNLHQGQEDGGAFTGIIIIIAMTVIIIRVIVTKSITNTWSAYILRIFEDIFIENFSRMSSLKECA